MKSQFLRQVASLFAKEDDLKEYTFIFPNRRSSMFFRMYLGQEHGKPMFAPRIKTISELFEGLSDLEVADKLVLVFRLWKVYTSLQEDLQIASGIKQEEVVTESLDDFMAWGNIILSDFNDVDQYLADPSRIFCNAKNLSDLKKSPEEILSDSQMEALSRIVNLRLFPDSGERDIRTKRRFFEIWDMLLPLYNTFCNLLEKDGIAYSAMAYRQVAEAIMAGDDSRGIISRLDKLGKAVFIGFSAPSECEKVLMRHFQDKDGYGLFYWDFYSEMVKAPQNRSSSLISECLNEFKCSRPIAVDGGVTGGKCSFNVIEACGATEQAMIASDLIKENDDINTAVVVSDEALLLPLLEVIKDIDINVTMGFPLKATSAASFYFLLFSLHLRSRLSCNGTMIPGDVMVSLLNHPYIKEIDPLQASKASREIQESNLYMLEEIELKKDEPLKVANDSPLADFIRLLVPDREMMEENTVNMVPLIVAYLDRISGFVIEYLSSIEKSFMNKFLDILDRLSSSEIVLVKPRSVYSVLRSAIKTQSVAFTGEPLKGVQIMGPLETRALDFDKIIFLSFNEGVFPATGEQTSCFPCFLRKGFGLPTYETDNSISAYNFYRLIQRASDVYMIYDTANTDSMKNKEESRFVKQLVYDFGIKPNKLKYNFPIPSSSEPFKSDLRMTEQDCESLKEFFTDLCPQGKKLRQFSASSLNSYLDCKRRFFLSKIMRIREEDELSDEVGMSDFGSIYHYCMQHIFDAYKSGGKNLKVDAALMNDIQDNLTTRKFIDIDDIIRKCFKEEMGVVRIEGQNLIIRESIKKYIEQTIKADLSRAEVEPFSIVGNEYPVDLNLGEDFSNASFYGVIDRLESDDVRNSIRICDYKTGTFIEKGSSDSSVYETLKKGGYKLQDKSHYLPYKVLDDGQFEKILEGMFAVGKKRRKFESVLFQMFVYAFLYCRRYGKTPPLDLSVYQLRLVNKFGPVTLRISQKQLNAFEERLKVLLREIKNLAVNKGTIEVCSDTDNCKFCDFNKYCRRIKSDD